MNKTLAVTLIVILGAALAGCGGSVPAPKGPGYQGPFVWQKLPTEPFKGKQDDIFFINPSIGWYVNNEGKIYKTTDGGASWVQQLNKPGTFFRCIGFIDERHGFAGNVGPDYYPGVTDSIALYETRDGGDTWTPVALPVPGPKGLCAIEIVRTPNGARVVAGGRVGGPAWLVESNDGGVSWKARDLSAIAGMILDVRFLNARTGFISASTSSTPADSHASILMTTDGGATWRQRYASTRPYELTWKSSFPSEKVGYVTVQSSDPSKTFSKRVLAKTIDGGMSWQEIELVDDVKVREFGVAFIDEQTGWVGTSTTGFQTVDGGRSWVPVDLGKYVNKIRLLHTPDGFVGYAIGSDVYKIDHHAAGVRSRPPQ